MITVNEERLNGLMDFYSRVALRTDAACEVRQASESTFFALKELLTAREELTALRANLKTVTDREKKLSDERRASADALDDAQRELARLKQEIAEDAKATAESQEITGKYMADAESAQREVQRLKTALLMLWAWVIGDHYDCLVRLTVMKWIDAGMKDPIPWPGGAFFDHWADEAGYVNQNGFVARAAIRGQG